MALDYRERVEFFDDRIRQEKFSIRLACVLALAVVGCGILSAILINQIFSSDDGLTRTIGTVASCFATLFSGFPLKDYPSLKNKIRAFRTFKGSYEELDRHPERAEDFELDKLEDIYWSLRKKVAGV